MRSSLKIATLWIFMLFQPMVRTPTTIRTRSRSTAGRIARNSVFGRHIGSKKRKIGGAAFHRKRCRSGKAFLAAVINDGQRKLAKPTVREFNTFFPFFIFNFFNSQENRQKYVSITSLVNKSCVHWSLS